MEIALRCGSCLRGGRDRPRLSSPRLRPRSSTRVDASGHRRAANGHRHRGLHVHVIEETCASTLPKLRDRIAWRAYYRGIWGCGGQVWDGLDRPVGQGGAYQALSSRHEPCRATRRNTQQATGVQRATGGNRRQGKSTSDGMSERHRTLPRNIPRGNSRYIANIP